MNLYPHQKPGIDHLLSKPFNRPHALLADSPGTGKTIMTIGAALKAGCKNGIIICPAIIKEQWARQMVKWGLCAEDEIQILYGTKPPIIRRPWVIANYDIARVKRVREQIASKKWHVLVMDEAQRLKTHDSQQTQSVFHKTYGIAVNAYWKWALSGTIMPNRPLELYPILKTMAPEVIKPYDNWPAYINRYCGGELSGGRGGTNIAELTERLQPFMLRRELKDVWQDCPTILENIVWLDVPFEKHKEWLGDGFHESATERRIIAESKIPYVSNYIEDRLQSGVEKLVVFTYHRTMTEALAKQLTNYKPVVVYGGISASDRVKCIEKFRTEGKTRVFIAQIVSSGEGVDGLQDVCNEIVLAEPEWSPGREDQAVDRIRRLGQSKPVILTKLLVANSYEENIYWTNQGKRKVIDIVMQPNGGSFNMGKEKKGIEENIQHIAESLERMATAQEQHLKATLEMYTVGLKGRQAALQAAPKPSNGNETPKQELNIPVVTTADVSTSSLTPVTYGITREEFTKAVIAILEPRGEEGAKACKTLNEQFGVKRLGEVPEEAFNKYLQLIQV